MAAVRLTTWLRGALSGRLADPALERIMHTPTTRALLLTTDAALPFAEAVLSLWVSLYHTGYVGPVWAGDGRGVRSPLLQAAHAEGLHRMTTAYAAYTTELPRLAAAATELRDVYAARGLANEADIMEHVSCAAGLRAAELRVLAAAVSCGTLSLDEVEAVLGAPEPRAALVERVQVSGGAEGAQQPLPEALYATEDSTTSAVPFIVWVRLEDLLPPGSPQQVRGNTACARTRACGNTARARAARGCRDARGTPRARVHCLRVSRPRGRRRRGRRGGVAPLALPRGARRGARRRVAAGRRRALGAPRGAPGKHRAAAAARAGMGRDGARGAWRAAG